MRMNLITLQEATDGITYILPPESRVEVMFILCAEPCVQIYLEDPKAKTQTTLSVARTDLTIG